MLRYRRFRAGSLLEGDEAEQRMRALFDSIDVDGGGTIDKDEMRDGLKRLGKSKQAGCDAARAAVAICCLRRALHFPWATPCNVSHRHLEQKSC